jgi:hypothetical protein
MSIIQDGTNYEFLRRQGIYLNPKTGFLQEPTIIKDPAPTSPDTRRLTAENLAAPTLTPEAKSALFDALDPFIKVDGMYLNLEEMINKVSKILEEAEKDPNKLKQLLTYTNENGENILTRALPQDPRLSFKEPSKDIPPADLDNRVFKLMLDKAEKDLSTTELKQLLTTVTDQLGKNNLLQIAAETNNTEAAEMMFTAAERKLNEKDLKETMRHLLLKEHYVRNPDIERGVEDRKRYYASNALEIAAQRGSKGVIDLILDKAAKYLPEGLLQDMFTEINERGSNPLIDAVVNYKYNLEGVNQILKSEALNKLKPNVLQEMLNATLKYFEAPSLSRLSKTEPPPKEILTQIQEKLNSLNN